jgi:hypothetical protein
MGKMVRAGAGVGAGIFDKLEPELEPHKNRPAPQHGLVENVFNIFLLVFRTVVLLLYTGTGTGTDSRYRYSIGDQNDSFLFESKVPVLLLDLGLFFWDKFLK